MMWKHYAVEHRIKKRSPDDPEAYEGDIFDFVMQVYHMKRLQ